MKVIGFTGDEIQTVYKILATILHLVIAHNTRRSFLTAAVAIQELLFIYFRQLSNVLAECSAFLAKILRVHIY